MRMQATEDNSGRKHPEDGEAGRFGFVSFALRSTLCLLLMVLISRHFAAGPFWRAALAVYIFSVPVILCGAYAGTIRQIRGLAIFARRGRLFRFMSARFLRIIFWVFWAPPTGFAMLFALHAYRPHEWGTLFLLIPLFWAVFARIRSGLAREIRPYLVTGFALSWSRRLCPLILLIVYIGAALAFGRLTAYDTLGQAVAAKKAAVADMNGGAVIREAALYLALFEGVKAYALGGLGRVDALLPLLAIGAGNLLIFYNVCAILSCLLIPSAEYRRLFGPLCDADRCPPVSPDRIFAISTIVTFVSVFVYLPLFAHTELWARRSPQIIETREAVESWAIPRVERIGDLVFREGTLAALDAARADALGAIDAEIRRLERAADRAFAEMEANIEGYLDWYYSLVAEYARIASLLAGDIEDYMAGVLEAHLRQGGALDALDRAVDRMRAVREKTLKTYEQRAGEILKENLLTSGASASGAGRHPSLREAAGALAREDMIDFRERLAVSGAGGAAAGAVSAVVIKKVIAKVVAKSTLKAGAKAMAKVVAQKTAGRVAGAGAGAAAGAAFGSIVPGVGTAAGAAVGGIIGGLVIGVSVDKLLIELEEAISRDDFRRELVAAIREERAAFKARFRAPY